MIAEIKAINFIPLEITQDPDTGEIIAKSSNIEYLKANLKREGYNDLEFSSPDDVFEELMTQPLDLPSWLNWGEGKSVLKPAKFVPKKVSKTMNIHPEIIDYFKSKPEAEGKNILFQKYLNQLKLLCKLQMRPYLYNIYGHHKIMFQSSYFYYIHKIYH